jgi:acetyltransferase
MAVRNLKHVFHPARVAVIGASSRPGSVGQAVFRNLLQAGFAGDVFPINLQHEEVQGHRAWARLEDLPAPADLAVICTPAATVPQLITECGQAGMRAVIILSAGFREIGAAGAALEQAVLAAAQPFDGLRLIGPNCLGVISPQSKLNASFAAQMPAQGRIAFISQSGALCTSVLDWAARDQIGFSHFVSVGNMLEVGIGDLIDYFADDPQTEAIILYVESINEAREFLSAARAFARQKPIVAFKSGRFAETARAAASHTGAMAGVDAVYEAALSRAGIVRVHEIEDMFDCARLLARPLRPRGGRLAIVTNAGGPGVIAADCLIECQGELATFTPETLDRLNALLPPHWSQGNPVDVLGDAPPERFAAALECVLADEGTDAVLVILTPQAMTDPTGVAESLAPLAAHADKPVLTAWMGGPLVAEGVKRLHAAGIPHYSTPEKAVRAFSDLLTYSRRREILYETPEDIPVEFPLDRSKLRSVFDTILAQGVDLLNESLSKALLEAYEIPVTEPFVARSADDAVEFSRRLAFPVVMKVFSPDITHKTDVGGVALNLTGDAEVRAAFDRIVTSARQARPGARIDGVTVQQMRTDPAGHELIVGALRDPVFGPVLLVGVGGIATELYQDRALELPPLNARLARRMLQSLRSWPLLTGYRGRPAINVDRLIEVMMRTSYLVADYPEILELDINPLLVTPRDVVALDARIVLNHEAILHPVRPFSHLAIRPYPEEFVQSAMLTDGTLVKLRPIKPEDEPMWHALLAACSPESLWFRFLHLFQGTTHEMATRYCFIDYDREIGMVAEVETAGVRRLIGVGRLVADADHHEAEYAVLVADAWHGRGLGNLLTDTCIEICRKWGIRRITAETVPENHRMIHMFRRRGFELDTRERGIVLARLHLQGG